MSAEKLTVAVERIAASMERIEKMLSQVRPAASAPAASGPTFGPFGRSKGRPIAGASKDDLEWYGARCVESLENPEKERFHEKERATLAAINAELMRQGLSTIAAPDDF